MRGGERVGQLQCRITLLPHLYVKSLRTAMTVIKAIHLFKTCCKNWTPVKQGMRGVMGVIARFNQLSFHSRFLFEAFERGDNIIKTVLSETIIVTIIIGSGNVENKKQCYKFNLLCLTKRVE